ncbi:MAG: acetyltransferase [Nitrospirae bacterium]|nr:MAG: acetyltransferase [Nitrospirota bacterium]
MKIITDNGSLGFDKLHLLKEFFDVIAYEDGCYSYIPHGFLTTWTSQAPNFGTFHIGKCTGIGLGSECKYDTDAQELKIGRFVSIGQRCRFILNGQHPEEYVSTSFLSIWGMQQPPVKMLGNTILENDIWMGDEVMVLGGARICNGVVIGARSLVTQNQVLEPYGFYAGSPASLKRFRFKDSVVRALLESEWWKYDLKHLKQVQSYFIINLNGDTEYVLESLGKMSQILKSLQPM